ncbi:glycosyltransferase [Bacillus gobiensis]|uniref:glycosyltransferase n=1 Tax=Bacillus gobiensis TaxID=1441095 RepID=UPI003D24026C
MNRANEATLGISGVVCSGAMLLLGFFTFWLDGSGWAITIAAFFGLIFGLTAVYCIKENKKTKLAGILFIVGAVFTGIISYGAGFLPAILYLLAGMITLERSSDGSSESSVNNDVESSPKSNSRSNSDISLETSSNSRLSDLKSNSDIKLETKPKAKHVNILFVFFVPSGGVETLNRQRSLALKKKNINCHFLYYRKARELINDHHGPTFITNDDDEIKRILAKGKYEAIIITSDYLALSRFRNLGYKGKLILEVQGYGAKDFARSELEKAIPYVTQYGNGLLNPKTPHIQEIFNKLFPDIPKFSFNNCFDTKTFSYQPQSKLLHPIVGWTGRIEYNKNWREFLQIGHHLIHDYNPKIQLYMFEDPSLSTPKEREEFLQLIGQLNLIDNITVFANAPHQSMAEYFSLIGDSGGFLCSTSRVEGAPYSILEAISCRCPVLTTDSDGVRSSIIHNQTGKYYTIGNIPEALQQAKELIENQSLRDHIISTALTHLKTSFTSEQYSLHFTKMLISLEVEI